MESTADQTIVEPDLALSPTQEQDSTPQSDADPISKDNVELASKPTNIKSTVPPKRPLTTGVLKRPSTSTTLAPSLKPTIVSTRASVGSTLSKPPSRPTITSTTARRPPITLSSTPLSHRSRPSIASTEDLKNVQASPVEPKRPMTAGTARRASLAPAGTTKSVISSVTASTGRRPPVATSSDNRSAMPNSKPAVPSRVSILSTPRTIRSSATTSNSTRPGAIQNGKKRLSTIPASPATQARSPLVKSKQPQSELMESTMSVDLQQKLEELRSIHKILRVTKTQDGGDKHDASEQEYAIEIEKILDDLSEKLKLSEARDNLPSKAKASIAQNATPLIATLSDGDDGHSKLAELEAEVADLKAKLAVVDTQGDQALGESDKASSNFHEEYQKNLSDLGARHKTELRKMEAESEEKNKAYEEEKQSLQEEHDKGLEEFRNSHSHQIGQLQVQLIERDALHQQDLEKVSKTLEDSKIVAFQRRSDETSAKLEALQQQLNREQINGSDAESKIEELQSNLADLQNRLEETQKAAALGTAAKAHLSKSVEEKDIFIRDKEEELGTTLDQVESLRSEHASQLSQIQTQHKDTKNRALELENSLNAMTLEHKSSLARKDLALQESLNTIKVLESLVHENVEKHNQSLSSKDTTIKSMNIDIENWDTAAVELASKHENAIKQKDGEINSYRLQVKELQSQVNATAEGNVKINKIRDLEINTMADKIKSLEETSSLSSNRMKNLSETKDQETETLHNSIKQLQMEIAAASDEHNDLIIQKNHKIITLQESIEGIESVSASNLEDLMATRDMETMGQKKKNRELEEALELVENERDSIKISLRESNDHAANVEVQKKRVEELEAAIQDYESKALDDQASVEKIHQSQIEEVRSKHASDLKNIRTAIEKRHGKDIEGLKSIHKGNIETTLSSIRAEHALKLASIQADVNKSDEDNQKLSNTLSSLQMELHKAKEVLAVEKKSTDTEYNQLKVELGDARNEVTALKKMLDIFDRESLEKDQSHSNSIQKIKSESEDTSKLLVDKTQSLQKVLADNANTLEKLKSESRKYQSNLKDADVKHTEVIQGLENEHAARDKESENAYLNSIAQLQQQLGDSVTNLDRAVEAERQLHADKINQLQTKQTVELEELQAQLIKFKSDCSTAQKELESMSNYEAELDLLKNKHAAKLDEQDKIHQRLKVKIAELSGNLNSSENSNNVQLQSHQLEIAEITRKLEAAQAARDMGVASHNEEFTALRRGHEHKLSELSTQMKLTEEEHEKQRQSGAEVRDRLVEQLRELEDARQSLPRLQGELVKSKQRVDHSDKEVNELRDSLDQAFVELNEERARTDDLREEVQALHDELDANAQGRGQANTELQKAHNTAKTAFIKEKSNNSVLKQQLEHATSATKLHLARVREVEAALKAHSAEIIELKTKISGPRASMTLGLAASKWVDNGNEAQMEDDSRDVGADLQGTMASINAQLKALEAINVDMIDDHQRIVTNLLNRPASSGTGKTGSFRTSTGALSADAPAFLPGSP